MDFIQWLIIVFVVAFVVPFFVYLFSRLQMTAWLNAYSDWNKKQTTEENQEDGE